ncbi:protein-methionine-sulfoxide reductase catalytic subunit MsrP [Pseudomonadales bacterium]|nr:protein-methionine-sulfoxide reductase catalytic subunit MsrP [Pseudomonadales bacterium]
MAILIKQAADILPSEITSESNYLNRRQLMGAAGAMAMGGLLSPAMHAAVDRSESPSLNYLAASQASPAGFYTPEVQTPYRYVTGYNNFYEFGTDKTDPEKHASKMVTDPWSVKIEGEVDRPGTYTLEDILKPHYLEERIYRLRCVEAWSMVVPWIGFPLADLLKRYGVGSKAKYVAFETLYRRNEMRGQRSRFGTIDWPYVEGLRLDEAMHPLTILAVGVYGKTMPNQNGAPIRLIVPWKYGFKSIKSIVSIRLTSRKPPTSWNRTAPNEYGFYSNVNPDVSHPRWSQASERRLPNSLLKPNRMDTLPFNGYAEQVAGLYRGMDLKRNF